ncbi:MAG: DUF362 domain-containing protein, partial [Dehalococcoidia bacterium]|nr:DUF362 domain-containing protein [Dehalococcoidia bacterium]
MIKVGITRGEDRSANVAAALELISDQVVIPDKPVLIKPNFVTVNDQLVATHVDATRKTLEFLAERGVKHFTIAEGPGGSTLEKAVENYGYRALTDDFDITFLDINRDEYVEVSTLDPQLDEQRLKMSKTLAESFIVSVCPMKTHDTVIVTLGLKNVLVGTLIGHTERQKLHSGFPAMNLSMAMMTQHVAPGLTVIDGTVGMQGDGPVDGYAIDSRVVVAAAHPFAADVVGLQVMGFELEQVGYLKYAMELDGLTLEDDGKSLGIPFEKLAKSTGN